MATLTSQENKCAEVRVNAYNSDLFAGRIDGLVKDAGGNVEFAKRCGVSESVVRSWRKGDTDPSRKRLLAIAHAFNLNLDWLVMGEGPKYRGEKNGNHGPNGEQSLFIYIPLYNSCASCGPSAWDDIQNVTEIMSIRRDWLHQELSQREDELILITVDSDAMEPTLHANDLVMVDRSIKEMAGPGIYALVMDGRLLIKRLQSLPGKKINVTADNPAYRPFVLDSIPNTDELYMVGKVVMEVRKL